MKPSLNKIKSSKSTEELLEFSIINIDKPTGPTSFGVDEIVKKMLGARKISHFGTLDPKVTGVLPIAINRACKLLGFFIRKDKTYVGIMHTHKNIETKELEKIIKKKFLGKIIQKPPVKSRVKRKERPREIYYFKLLEKDGRDVLFEVKCEAGTYVRKLISDLGNEIGGAHMSELRRKEAGIFNEGDKNFVNLYEFEKAVKDWKKGNDKKLREILIPGEIIMKIMPVVQIKKHEISKLWHGSPIFKKFIKSKPQKLKKDDLIAVFSGQKFIGVYKITNEKNIIARPEFVMQPLIRKFS